MASSENTSPPLPPRYDELKQNATMSSEKVERAAKEFQTFITFIFSVSIFGASAFAVVVGQMTDPEDCRDGDDPPPFSLKTVRFFLACAWLCFIMSLAVAGYTLSALTILLQRVPGQYDSEWSWRWELGGILVSALLHLLLIGAFLFLSLAMVAYVGVVGWIAVGCCTAAGLLVMSLVTYQLA